MTAAPNGSRSRRRDSPACCPPTGRPTASRLKKSTDAGKSWSEVGAPPGQRWVDIFVAAGGALYFQYDGDSALWRSRDGGATWQRLLDGSGPLLVHPLRPRTLYCSRRAGSNHPRELVVSRNGGDSWKVLGPLPFYLQKLNIDPVSGTFYGARGTFQYGQAVLTRSVDGKTWETLFTTPSTEADVAHLSFRPGRPRQQALTIGLNLYRSFDGGASWAWRATPDRPGAVALDGDDPNRLIAVTSHYAFLSTDGGRTWRTTSAEITYGEGLIRSDQSTLFAIGCGIARSTDNGESWRIVLPCETPYADVGRWAAKLDVDPVRLDRVYALSFQANPDSLPHDPFQGRWPSSLWRSEDGGTTWRKVAANLRAFALERGTGKLYGIRNTVLLTSADAGRTWRTVGTAPAGAMDLIADPAEPGVLYANGSGGLQRSSDQGTTWETINPAGGWVLQFHPANPRVIFTSTQDGVYRLTLP